jgi:hypothetical protein
MSPTGTPMTNPSQRLTLATALSAFAFALPLHAQRRVDHNRLYSDSLPRVVLALDSPLTYLGTQSFVLYGVATAEQHFFAELDGKRIKRFVWIQFEGYLPSSNGRFDYSADSTIRLWDRPIFHSGSLLQTPVTERRPDSDGAKARQFVHERGLTFSSAMLYHRLVSIADPSRRHELMIIYMEDPANYGQSATSLTAGATQQLLTLSLAHVGQAIRVQPR